MGIKKIYNIRNLDMEDMEDIGTNGKMLWTVEENILANNIHYFDIFYSEYSMPMSPSGALRVNNWRVYDKLNKKTMTDVLEIIKYVNHGGTFEATFWKGVANADWAVDENGDAEEIN